MEFNLTHLKFWDPLHRRLLKSILTECVKTLDFQTFMNEMEKLQVTDTKECTMESLNCLKGDLFELFAEIFFKIYESHPSVGLTNYEVVDLVDDLGMDASAVNVSGQPCAVQVKYRANPLEEITYGDICKTYRQATTKYNIPIGVDNTFYLFMSCYDITHVLKKDFGNELNTIGKREIQAMCDNNKTFWTKCLEYASIID